MECHEWNSGSHASSENFDRPHWCHWIWLIFVLYIFIHCKFQLFIGNTWPKLFLPPHLNEFSWPTSLHMMVNLFYILCTFFYETALWNSLWYFHNFHSYCSAKYDDNMGNFRMVKILSYAWIATFHFEEYYALFALGSTQIQEKRPEEGRQD